MERKPWLTWAAAAVCIVVYAGAGLRGEAPSWDTLAMWGAPPPQAIWGGAYWALITSVFVHLALWHLAFNLYWLWILGRTLERSIGSLRWLGLFLGAAIVSSGVELGASGSTGIGLSGVIYAIFGFMWVAKRSYPAFSRVVTRQTVWLFIGWLIGCVLATVLRVWNVGNAAHISGLALGLTTGAAFVRRPDSAGPKTAVALLLVGSVVPLFWCPWSFQWVAAKGYEAHERGDYRSAVVWYLRSQRFNQEPVWVLQNLAFAYHSLGNTTSFAATMEKLRRLKPDAASAVERDIEAPPATVTPSGAK
ncbi:MAG TPA: rhomboid family intramembrane serine protease [Thermoanaerobaculia bacterium]|nr:rhomboid family intramembrane serine protease [Thermoanaerobaculia bacterium]